MEKKKAVSVVIEDDGKYLLVKRADHDTYPGLWEFPGGGIDNFESPKDSSYREVFEETGLEVDSLEYVCEYEWERREKDNIHITMFYSAEFSGDVKISHEHSDFLWLGEDDIYGLDYFSTDVHKFFDWKKSSKQA